MAARTDDAGLSVAASVASCNTKWPALRPGPYDYAEGLDPPATLRRDAYALYEAHMRPLLEGAIEPSANGFGVKARINAQCDSMTAEYRRYWTEQTDSVLRGDRQAMDPGTLYACQQKLGAELIARLSGGAMGRMVDLERVKAHGFDGFRKMPKHTTSTSEVRLTFESDPNVMYLSARASDIPQAATEDPGFHVKADGSGLYAHHRVQAQKQALSPDKTSHLSASWDETPVSVKSFWAFQTSRLLGKLLARSAGAYVYLRTDIMLERLWTYRNIVTTYRPKLPKDLFPQSLSRPAVAPVDKPAIEPIADRIWKEESAFNSEETVFPEVFSPKRSPESFETSASAKTSPERAHPKPSQKPGSETPILDLLVGGNAKKLSTKALVTAACGGIAHRIKLYPGMSLVGRYCGMRIDFNPRSEDVIGIRSRLLVNSTRRQLSKKSKVNAFRRETFCEWLLKSLVAWNRRAFPEIEHLQIFENRDEFGEVGRRPSSVDLLGLVLPKYLTHGMDDEIVNVIMKRLRSRVSEVDPSHVLLRGKRGLHRTSPLASKLSSWSLMDVEGGCAKQLRACFHLGASPQDEVLELLEQKLYWFLTACPDVLKK